MLRVRHLYFLFSRRYAVKTTPLTTLTTGFAPPPNPKQQLLTLLSEAATRIQSSQCLPLFSTTHANRGTTGVKRWKTRLTLQWPKALTFEYSANRRTDAEKGAAALALQKLNEMDPQNTFDGSVVPVSTIRNAKCLLGNVLTTVSVFYKQPYLGHYSSEHVLRGRASLKQVTLTLQWPETLTFTHIAQNKKIGETLAAEEALRKLQAIGAIDSNFKPVLFSKEQLQSFRKWQRFPVPVTLNEEILKKMNTFNNQVEGFLPKTRTFDSQSEGLMSSCEGPGFNEMGIPVDVITGSVLHPVDPAILKERNAEMLMQLENRSSQPNRKMLPIHEFRSELDYFLSEFPICMIFGATGSGKTTQVPQFLLDVYTQQYRGSNCNIVITQPRRISALSMARRVAEERNERLGETVGYCVRLENVPPQRPAGRLLFCSTGVLLKRLLDNPMLQGISHVIVDEAHERDIPTDILLTLLKKITQMPGAPKVVLMSATMDVSGLTTYFGNCPVFEVPGRVFPVRQHYLNAVQSMVPYRINDFAASMGSRTVMHVDAASVAAVIDMIHKSRPPGAVLCFLPGWQEICTVRDNLNKRPIARHLSIISIHSRFPLHDQYKIFSRPPEGTRKVVLATNIAETSLTIDDVVYVIDVGLHRQLCYSPERGVSSLQLCPITKANTRQRWGRAGRTQPGECFHLYSERMADSMDDFPKPEIQRAALESVVLESKMYAPNIPAVGFLSETPNPPSEESVQRAVSDLIDIGVLTPQEQLTPLGKIVAQIPIHPRLAKTLTCSAFYRCVNPLLTIAASLTSNRDVFFTTPETSGQVKEARHEYSDNNQSDHLTADAVYSGWRQLRQSGGETASREYCLNNHINFQNMDLIDGLRKMLGDQLKELGLIDDQSNECSESLARLVLAAGLSPRVLRVLPGEISKNRIYMDETNFVNREGEYTALRSSSVVSKLEHDELRTPWLVYFHSIYSPERRVDLVQEATVIPTLALLLTAGQSLQMKEIPLSLLHLIPPTLTDPVVLEIDNRDSMCCCCQRNVATAVMALRDSIQRLFVYWLSSKCSSRSARDEMNWRDIDASKANCLHSELLKILQESLNAAQEVPMQSQPWVTG